MFVSFDSSNPFREMSRWQEFSTHIEFLPDAPFVIVKPLRARKEDAVYFDNPYSPKSPMLEGVTSQDLFPDYIDARSGLDGLSNQILMLNNLYMRLLSNYQVNHIADKFRGEHALALQKGITPDPSFIQDALDIEDIIFEIFRSEKPLSLIDKHRGNFDSYF
jgi:hypothetical protein